MSQDDHALRSTRPRSALAVAVIAAGLGIAATADAQGLKQPQDSAAATVKQTIGNTDVTVIYHRPAVKGRAIWGALVPYDEVWRAGANENTKIVFSTDVKVNGKPLPAGTYGFHTIPTAKDWTAIFNKVSDAWGSYSYDPKQDALRLTVTPRTTPASEERLSYRFDDVAATKATLV